MSAQDNIQTTKSIYAAFKRGDRGAMLALCAEDVKLLLETGAGELPWAGVYEGHAGVEANQDRLAEHVEVSQLEELDFLSSDNQVAAVLQAEMTLKKMAGKQVFRTTFNSGPSTRPVKSRVLARSMTRPRSWRRGAGETLVLLLDSGSQR